ncbi:MAG: hypothetical protein SGJ20_11530 [Planctomycetota bacterium]|nr:hypothetical protein [Planctomycetota bacterium]
MQAVSPSQPKNSANRYRTRCIGRSRMRQSMLIFGLFIGYCLASISSAHAANLELKPHDHITIIGNTLADRMQHSGWVEARLQLRFPKHELVIRNIGYAGDEIPLAKRLRSQDFGSPDQWLTKLKTDVVFAFFGYNESFAGEAGLRSSRRTCATSFSTRCVKSTTASLHLDWCCFHR